MAGASRGGLLPPEVNRILFVKNLPFKMTSDEMFDLFGKYGAVRQIRVGNAKDTKGTAFVVYEDIYDAKNALEHLSGFQVGGRYLVILYHKKEIAQRRKTLQKKAAEIDALRKQYGISSGSKS